MAQVAANGIDIEVDEAGDPDGPPLLMVMGLGAQLISWDEGLVGALADAGHRVIRFDNRDVGLSTKVHDAPDAAEALVQALSGEPIEAAYTLWDMAADAVGVLDALGIDSAHVMGASMGGMIVQSMAIAHPARVRSMTSIMSTTGESDVGQPHPEALVGLLKHTPTEREAAVAHAVDVTRIISGERYFDEVKARKRAEESYDRCFYPEGVTRQLLAIVASGSRADGLAGLDLPALVVHGDVDPLVDVSGGHRTHELVAGSELLVMEDAGHEIPEVFWPAIVEGVGRATGHAA